MAVLNSQLRLTLLDQVTGRARGIMGTLNRLRATANATASGGMFAGLGGRLAMLTGGAASIYGVSRAFTSALSVAGDFEQSMNRLQVTSGATRGEMAALQKQSLELGRTTMFMASEVGGAQNFLAMAGLNAQEILGAMPTTLDLAAASGMELAATGDLASNVMQQWGKSAEELSGINDVLTTTFQKSNTNLAQLGEAMSYLAPVANMMGMEFEEMSAAVGLLGNAGIQGSRAGTGLQQAMNKLVNPSKSARGLLNEFGVSVTDSNGNVRDFADILEDFEGAFGDVASSVLDASGNMLEHEEAVEALMGTGEKGAAIFEIFGQRAGPAFAALIAQGSRRLREFTREVGNNEGATRRAAAVMERGWNGALRAFWSAYEGMQIAFGSRMTRAFEGPMRSLTGYFGEITAFIETLDRRVSIFQRLGTGARAFFQGLGFADATSALTAFREFAVNGIFGSADPAQMVRDTEDMGRMWVKMRRIGEDVRAFIDDVSFGNLNKAVRSIWDAFSDLPGMGQVLTLWAAGKGLALLAAGTLALANSPVFRAAAALFAIGMTIDMFRNAESFSDFVDSLQQLSTIEWLGIAAGALVVSGVLWKLGSNALRIVGAMRSLFALKPPVPKTSPAVPAARTPTATPGTNFGANPPKKWTGPWGRATPAPTVPTGPSGPRGLGPQRPGAAPWSFGGWAGIGNALKGGALTAITNYLGEKAIAAGFRAAGKETVELPSIMDNIRTILQELNVDRSGDGTGSQEGAAWDAIREMPDHAAEMQAIRDAIQSGNAGTQKVDVTNPVRPNVTVNMNNTFNNTADPQGIARQIGDAVRGQAEGYLSDGGM